MSDAARAAARNIDRRTVARVCASGAFGDWLVVAADGDQVDNCTIVGIDSGESAGSASNVSTGSSASSVVASSSASGVRGTSSRVDCDTMAAVGSAGGLGRSNSRLDGRTRTASRGNDDFFGVVSRAAGIGIGGIAGAVLTQLLPTSVVRHGCSACRKFVLISSAVKSTIARASWAKWTGASALVYDSREAVSASVQFWRVNA